MGAGSEIDVLRERIEKANREAEGLVSGDAESSTELVHIGKTGVAVKRQMAARKQLIEDKRQEIEKLSDQMRDLMERQMAEVQKMLSPLEKMMRQLEEGIWTVNLYLGREEKIVTLRKGEPASADTPIHIRQLVLAMDQETAIDPEDNGIDHMDIERFDDWLTESDDHIDQVIPDEKGIVAIRPRNSETKEYGSLSANMSAKEADEHTYFLIRNGECVYRLWTNFSVGAHMIPPADEFTKLFQRRRFNFETREHEVEEITPDSYHYEEAEEEAEHRQRHYMRMGLILQGLADRTAVFHPLPEFGVNFLSSTTHKEGKVRFIMDAEDTLGTGREPFDQWLARVNGELRPGMRVVGAFEGPIWEEANHNSRESRYRGHSQLRPESALSPDSWVPRVIDGRDSNGQLLVKYVRSDKRYDYWEGSVPYKKRASVLIPPSAKFVIAIDFVDAEVMEDYLRARTERESYLYMFPLLKAAILVKREEAAAEAPFKELIAAHIVTEHDAGIEEAKRATDELVEWWKLKNRVHRPLTGTDQDRKALTEIVAEFANRKKLDKTATPPELLRKLQRAHPDALLIARRPDGHHVVLKPEDDGDVFVAIGVYTKTGKVKEQKRWKLPPRNVLSWRTFYASPRWKRWRRGASVSEYLTGPEKERLAASVTEKDTIAVTYYQRGEKIEVWKINPVEVPRKPRVKYWREEESWLCTDHGWKRDGKGNAVLTPTSRWNRDHQYSGHHPWESKARSQYGESRVVLFENKDAIAKQDRRIEQAGKVARAGQKLEAILRRADYSIEEQWLAREEERMRKEFVAEYGDPGLWEGHRKTVTDPYAPSDLDVEFLATLIEDGHDINGLTLGQAAAQANASIPTDYAEFVIDTTEPDPEPEDDDEEEDEG